MRPFFYYFGGKYRAVPHYPPPVHPVIVEPFAGSAGYSVRYFDRRVVLVDRSPLIASLWAYLIRVSHQEIQALPEVVEHVDEVRGPQEARWLIGFWLNKATTTPRKVPSSWMRSGIRLDSCWGSVIRERIARQVGLIRHWKVRQGSYEDCHDQEATWFVDPPYDCPASKLYPFHEIDYPRLATWCRSRCGQTIVCEAEGATWLPFTTLASIKVMRSNKRSAEVIWTGDGP